MTKALLLIALLIGMAGQGKEQTATPDSYTNLAGVNTEPPFYTDHCYSWMAAEIKAGTIRCVRPRLQDLLPLPEPLPPCITKSRTVDESRSNPLMEFDEKIVFVGPHPSRCSVSSWKNTDLVWDHAEDTAPLMCKPDKSGTGFLCKVARVEPAVVPAIQEKRLTHHRGDACPIMDGAICLYSQDVHELVWTCAEPSRVLLHSLDNTKHWCVRF
jgi:hypothetical protein